MAKQSWRGDATPRAPKEYRIGVDEANGMIFVEEIEGGAIRTIMTANSAVSLSIARKLVSGSTAFNYK